MLIYSNLRLFQKHSCSSAVGAPRKGERDGGAFQLQQIGDAVGDWEKAIRIYQKTGKWWDIWHFLLNSPSQPPKSFLLWCVSSFLEIAWEKAAWKKRPLALMKKDWWRITSILKPYMECQEPRFLSSFQSTIPSRDPRKSYFQFNSYPTIPPRCGSGKLLRHVFLAWINLHIFSICNDVQCCQ